MTGTGTQADPYIITSVADLYSMETLGGAAVYFELGADIDFIAGFAFFGGRLAHAVDAGTDIAERIFIACIPC